MFGDKSSLNMKIKVLMLISTIVAPSVLLVMQPIAKADTRNSVASDVQSTVSE